MPTKIEREREALRKKHIVKTKKTAPVEDADEKDPQLDELMRDLQKKHGKESIARFTANAAERGSVKFFSTGFQTIDDAISGDINKKRETVKGTGKGLPIGRIVEIYGPESSGKSTFMLTLIAAMQKLGERAAYIDVEHSFDPEYAAKLGVNLNKLAMSQPLSAEQALDLTIDLVKSGKLRLVVVDSVAGLVPEKEDEGDMAANQMGLQARLMGKALRKLIGYCSRHNCTVIFVNQIRMKLGIVFGNPETTPGGGALKFYASVRLEIRGAQLKVGGKKVGKRSKVTVVKNKISVPFREWHMDIKEGRGITNVYAALEFGKGKGNNDE